LLAQRFAGYEPRAGQVDLAQAVAGAIDAERHLFAEAPTGTGKSIGYLVPAILARKKTIVVTANIALQEQLVGKDLPMLAGLLPKPFTFALLKGVNNYLCLHKLHPAGTEGMALEPQDEQHAAVQQWAKTTGTWDVSDLPFHPGPGLWRDFSVSWDECLGRKCRYAEECYSRQARKRARESDVIVTNYHLFFANLAITTRGANGILPDADVVILDEGHKAPDIAREFFGFSLSHWRVARVANRLAKLRGGKKKAASLERQSRLVFDWAGRLLKSKSYRASLRKDAIPAAEVINCLTVATVTLAKSKVPEDIKASEDAAKLAGEFEDAMLRADPERPGFDRFVYYLEERGKTKFTTICRKPIYAADALGDNLFPLYSSVVVTSATLSTFGKFDFILGEFGAPARTATIECSSPFNFREQALIVTPRMPAPQSAEYPDAVARLVWDAVRTADGRTLALFTSYRNLQRAYDYLVREGCPYRLLRQGGDLSRGALIAAFKEDVHSVLLGTESFWAGVDIPGEALSCVVMDRLPFASPEDPVMDAISQRNDRWFFDRSMPQAIIAFKQGFGRLIRTQTDRGACVIGDSRITEKAYGANFIRSLPACQRSTDINAVRGFLQ